MMKDKNWMMNETKITKIFFCKCFKLNHNNFAIAIAFQEENRIYSNVSFIYMKKYQIIFLNVFFC